MQKAGLTNMFGKKSQQGVEEHTLFSVIRKHILSEAESIIDRHCQHCGKMMGNESLSKRQIVVTFPPNNSDRNTNIKIPGPLTRAQ